MKESLIRKTVALAEKNASEGGRPFACLIARGEKIIAASGNLVAQTWDPTAHAEIVAIREACTKLKREHLTGCDIHIMAHPGPMCLAAMYYCSPDRVIFPSTREDYSPFYVDDRKYFTLGSFYGNFPGRGKNGTSP